MATVYSVSDRNQSSGIAVTQAGGLGDKKLARATYYVKMEQAGLAALIYFVFRWKDRDGSTQQHVSAALSVAGIGRIGDVVPLWTEDAGGAGAAFEWEIVTVGVLGAGRYEYFVELDEAATGV